jgi:hypothetical protein
MVKFKVVLLLTHAIVPVAVVHTSEFRTGGSPQLERVDLVEAQLPLRSPSAALQATSMAPLPCWTAGQCWNVGLFSLDT